MDVVSALNVVLINLPLKTAGAPKSLREWMLSLCLYPSLVLSEGEHHSIRMYAVVIEKP